MIRFSWKTCSDAGIRQTGLPWKTHRTRARRVRSSLSSMPYPPNLRESTWAQPWEWRTGGWTLRTGKPASRGERSGSSPAAPSTRTGSRGRGSLTPWQTPWPRSKPAWSPVAETGGIGGGWVSRRGLGRCGTDCVCDRVICDAPQLGLTGT